MRWSGGFCVGTAVRPAFQGDFLGEKWARKPLVGVVGEANVAEKGPLYRDF